MATWSTQSATRECQMNANGELTVVERLASLLETGEFADVTIHCGSGNGTATFKAHRLLLATASSSLQKLLAANNSGPGGECSVLHFRDVEPDAFQHLLRFIYTDNVEITSVHDAVSLFRLSKNWCLNKLKERTLKFLSNFLEIFEPSSEEKKNELCDLVLLMDDDGGELSDKCWKTVVKHANKVIPCQGFLDMNQNQVKKLLSHDDFDYKNNLVLFEAIRDWGMNQVLERRLKVNQLQDVIGNLMEYVNFKAIKDNEFLQTILPSDCLNKGDLIAFFMTRGLEIPRDLALNNRDSIPQNNFEKTRRYKRGYKLPDKEIYKEHELRFRVDQKLRLLGVGFGFLFSNTDMGITVHCKGPWETRQWSDIIQTYCRVTWEKMKTADVRLMFSEAVTIEPNQSYKVLVRVSRMSDGTSSVDLWGGSLGESSLKTENAEFSFLKTAVPSDEEVSDADKDNTPGMITDLIYQLWDGTEQITASMGGDIPPLSPTPPRRLSHELTPPKPLSVHRSQKKPDVPQPKKILTDKIESFLPSKSSSDRTSPVSSPKITTHVRKLSIIKVEEPQVTPSWVKKKQDTTSTNLYKKPSPYSETGTSERIPSFLRSRQKLSDTSRPTWEIPSRYKADKKISTDNSKKIESKEQPENKYGTSSRFASDIVNRYGSKLSTSKYETSSFSKYGSGLTSKYGSGTTESESSKKGKSDSTTSRYGANSPGSTTSSRYGTSNGIGSTRFGTQELATSRYNSGQDSTSSKYGSSSSTDLTSSRYGTASGLNSPSSRFGTSSSNYTTSRYGSSTAKTPEPTTKIYGAKSPEQNPSRYGAKALESNFSKYTSKTPDSTTSRFDSTNKLGSPLRYNSTTPDSSATRYNAITTQDTIGSRYGSGSSTSKYGSNITSEPSKYGSSTSRYSTPSKYGNDYSSTPTSKYSTSSRYSTKTEVPSSSALPTQNGLDSSPVSKYGGGNISRDSLTSGTGSSRFKSYTPSLSGSRFGGTSSSSRTTTARDSTPSRQTASSSQSKFDTTSSLGSNYSSRFVR